MAPLAEPISQSADITNGPNGVANMTKEITNGSHAREPAASFGSGLQVLDTELLDRLSSPSAEAKIWGIAAKALYQANFLRLYPEYTKPGGTEYVYRELDFWTSGFFPGSLHLLLERRKKYPHLLSSTANKPHDIQLDFACKWWTENLHQNAVLKGTHDLGFMVMPWTSLSWELNQDARALETMKTTAKTLASRFSPEVGCIRSWDTCKTRKYDFRDTDSEFLVIIDNMMNLSLLFFVAAQTNDNAMREVAIQHARTTAKTHIRDDYSTTHLVVFCPRTGAVKGRLTNQGFSHTSCWSRGQAWAIAGFSEAYQWTQMDEFLDTARRCADYFIKNLPPSGVAPWDFDAYAHASGTGEDQPPDTSATMIAAYGMLLIHRALSSRGQPSQHLAAALRLAEAVCSLHLNPEANYTTREETVETVEHGVLHVPAAVEVDMGHGETILNGATINNYEFAPRRWADHGLVYADYYFLLFGNELLKMNLGSFIGRLEM